MTFFYLATPYSKYPLGTNEAYIDACKQATLFVQAGVPVFCPIAHTHGLAVYGSINLTVYGSVNLTDNNIWLPADRPFMLAAKALVVCKLPSWERSTGIRHEILTFAGQGKPIYYMEPGVIPPDLLHPKQPKPDFRDIPVGFRG